MNNEWFLAASAGATLLLAIAAFWTIWQNYTFRKKDRELNIKSRALDEIRNWAIEVHRVELLSYSGNEDEKMEARRHLALLLTTGVSVYDGACIFGEEMGEKVEIVINSLRKIREALFSAHTVVNESSNKELWDSLFYLFVAVSKRKIELFTSTKNFEK